MKVIDFGAGCPLAVLNNWVTLCSGGPAFIRQSCIVEILGGIQNEIHCYDKLSIPEHEIKQTFMTSAGEIILHENKRKLPRSADMICAFNPDPVSIFGAGINSSYPALKQAHYHEYALSLAHMVRTRLRIGGLLVIQFDECVKPPMNVPYDATQPFLTKVVAHSQSNMQSIYHSDSLPAGDAVVPFRGAYTFSSIHIYQKLEHILGR